ncbi:hypothetical protein ACU8V4_16510 [Pseudoalteromonas mariniglutinosa]
MESNTFLGLVKFFRNENFLDSLLSGCFHCTPPEIYRMDNQEGISDRFESCGFSYRKDRGDEPVILNIGGMNIEDSLGITIHNRKEKDAWMHCWFTLRLPDSPAALEKLKADIKKMKEQFGQYYAFIPAPNLKPFVEKLQILSDKAMIWGEVEYCGDKSKWGNLVKGLDYSYQREYRFLFGECSTSEKAYYIFEDANGFSDLIFKNTEVKLQSKDSNEVWFDLSA